MAVEIPQEWLAFWAQFEPYTLMPYQEEACQAIVDPRQCSIRGRKVEGDEMGMGKTGINFEAWKRLSQGHPSQSYTGVAGPGLLIAGNNALYTWWRLAPHWRVPRPIRIDGNAGARKALWERYANKKDTFVCCTREVFLRDMAAGVVPLRWQIVFTDEAHKHNNRKTKIFEALKKLDSTWMIINTGSPMKRGPENLWALLNLINPKRWSSYWRYVENYCHVVKNQFGAYEIIGPRGDGRLQKDVALDFIRRTKKLLNLPGKTRSKAEVQMSPLQRRVYTGLVEASLAELQSALVVAPTVLAKITRIRQLLTTPKLLDPTAEDGAAIEDLVERLEESDDKHWCIYTGFAAAIPHIKARLLREGYPEENIVTLRGGMKTEELDLALKRFKETKGIAICSILFAESFDLVPSCWGYFLGPQWDPEENYQAEDRQYRVTTTEKVHFFYAYHDEAFTDVNQWAVLDRKANAARRSLHNIEDVRQMILQQRGVT
jgi:SNF2 family DNA or RNA helicase